MFHSQASQHQPFRLGQLVATPGAIQAMAAAGQDPAVLIDRHRRGDWGEVGQEDWQANDQALQSGGRLLSAYTIGDDVRIWIITEADRSSSCVLLPDEY